MADIQEATIVKEDKRVPEDSQEEPNPDFETPKNDEGKHQECSEDDTKQEKENENENEKETEEQSSSPRGVLEKLLSGSDSDHSSSFGSEDKSPVEKEGGGEFSYGNLHWKKLLGQVKRRSARRFSIVPLIPLLSGDFSRRGKKKLLDKDSTEEEAIDADFIMPKPSWRNFSFEELQQATDNFSPDKLIGKGGHAEVYKGCLSDGQIVAVKKVIKKEKKNDEGRVGDFLSELGIIAHIDHPNAAKLIGFSAEAGLHLVLQFLPHGSLASLLHGAEECLEWKIRYKVAIGVAEGLQYLHYNCQRRIIHRDITASNILLSEDYEAQISDFGLAKWLPEKWVHHVVSPIEGTFGYMAPEYFMHGVVHEKTDVFAFGVLLLELITGRRAVDASRQSLVMWAKPLLDKNNIKEVADPRLGTSYDILEMKRAMYTASICIHHLPNLRPTMKRAVQLLRGEKEMMEMKQKTLSGRALILDVCDLDEYTSTTYLKDLNRHMELVME